jgi:uncharacterized membrane protein (UPF0127 family)
MRQPAQREPAILPGHTHEHRAPLPRLPALAIAAFWIALPAIGASACEPRIEEPVPPARTEAQRPADQSADRAPLSERSSPTQRARCIKQTPDTPARTTPPSPDPACPPDPETPPKLRKGKVIFKEAGGKEVEVEIAESERTRERGLMYRKAMDDTRGMIFTFQERTNHTFWMHNTCIPLDMLFIDGDGTIVGIEENTPTMNDSTFQVGCPSKYVLEVNAGWTRRNGVKAGQRVELQGI